MAKTKLLQWTRRPSVTLDTADSEAYYAHHAVALLVLLLLWRLPHAITRPRGSVDDTKTRPVDALARKSPNEKQRPNVVSEDDLEALRELYPNSTPAERRRFLLARHGDQKRAAAQLGAYLEWREKHDDIDRVLPDSSIETDGDDWNRAAEVALKAAGKELVRLPRLARTYLADGSAVCDLDGYRVIHLMPGMMDFTLADPSTYAVTLALYLDRKVDRASTEVCTVLLDVRGGAGWPNIPPRRYLPFIKTVTKLLLSMFPERLFQCLLYPLPPAALWMWNLARVWIDPKTASKINLLSGPCMIESPPPFLQMECHLGSDVIDLLENERKSTFNWEPQ